MKIRNVCSAPEKSRSIARRFLRFAPRILSTICRRHFPARKFVCVLFSCTICPSKLRTIDSASFVLRSFLKRRENRPPTSPGQPASGGGCAGHSQHSQLAHSFSMTTFSSDPALLAIIGPTASGKSALGIFLAKEFGGEVVACDSTQLYRGFDIGTAKPALAERAGIPHHLLDILDPSDESTAGGYRERALAVLDNLRARSRLPIFTVGTGMYLRALLEGLAELPLRSEELRERLRVASATHGPGYLHKILTHLDRHAAAQIAPPDKQKLIRAIEFCLLAKKPISEVHRAGRT